MSIVGIKLGIARTVLDHIVDQLSVDPWVSIAEYPFLHVSNCFYTLLIYWNLLVP